MRWLISIISFFLILHLVSADYIQATANFVIPTYCGDGLCVINENCATCPEDCGACPTSEPSGRRRSVSIVFCANGMINTSCICGGATYDTGFCFLNVYFLNNPAQNLTEEKIIEIPKNITLPLNFSYTLNNRQVMIQVHREGNATDIDNIFLVINGIPEISKYTHIGLGNYVVNLPENLTGSLQLRIAKENSFVSKEIELEPIQKIEDVEQKESVPEHKTSLKYENWIYPIITIIFVIGLFYIKQHWSKKSFKKKTEKSPKKHRKQKISSNQVHKPPAKKSVKKIDRTDKSSRKSHKRKSKK